MLESYVDKSFSDDHLAVIDQANEIIAEYERQGFDLTLRQLYYQFVARDLIPNTMRSYKRIGTIINDARLAGLVSWLAIVDRTRNLRSNPHWDSPSNIVESCAAQFAYDKWEDQPARVEVWIEKDALIGVIERACNDLDVPYYACRGYNSQSEAWRAGRRFSRYTRADQNVVVLHFGDHDPSGIDMTRDNADRLAMFTGQGVEVIRVALNMDQVEQYSPPPNPTKLTDSRAEGYITIFGHDSWELDALEPSVIDGLIRKHVSLNLDTDLWAAAVERQDEARDVLRRISDRWDDVQDFLSD